MKKTYLKPETETIIMNAERVICASDALSMRDDIDAILDANDVLIMEGNKRNSFNIDLW